MKSFFLVLLLGSSHLANAAGKHFWSFCVVTATICQDGDECVIQESVWAATPTDNYADWDRKQEDYASENSDEGNAFRPVDTDDSCDGQSGAVCVKLRDNQLSNPYDGTSLGSCREVEDLNGPNVSGDNGFRTGDCTVRLECS